MTATTTMKQVWARPYRLVLASALILTVASYAFTSAATNPIPVANNSFESGSGNTANNWGTVNWGSHSTTFSIKTGSAQDGNRSSRIDVSNYVNGDSRWSMNQVELVPGATYQVSHWYKSNVTTQIDAAITKSDGSVSYVWLGDAPASSSWKQSDLTFTAPAGAKSADIYHLINKNGWLETDNFSLSSNTAEPIPEPTPAPAPEPSPSPTPSPSPSTNIVPNSSVENGTANTITNWSSNTWGSNSAQFSVTSRSAKDGNRAARVDVNSFSSGDAKWSYNKATVKPSESYEFTNWYKSNVPTQLNAAITHQNGNISYIWLGDVPATNSWAQAKATYKMPADAKSITTLHLIASNGWLETDAYNLTNISATPAPTPEPTPTPTPPASGAFSSPLVSIEFDDGWGSAYRLGLPAVESFGWKPTQYIITQTAYNNANYGAGTYMTPAQIQDWNRRADIGSHTIDHSNIPSLPQSQIKSQLTDSKAYLDNLLGEPTNLYVSPYCASSQAVVDVAKTQYQSLRNCDARMNKSADFDRWNLNSFIVLNTTTDAEIKAQLADAKANNGWLILVWHEIDGDNKNAWSVSQARLKHQLQLVKDAGIEVTTTQRALDISVSN